MSYDTNLGASIMCFLICVYLLRHQDTASGIAVMTGCIHSKAHAVAMSAASKLRSLLTD